MKCILCNRESEHPVCQSCLAGLVDSSLDFKVKPLKFDPFLNRILYKNKWVVPSKRVFAEILRNSLRIQNTSFYNKSSLEEILKNSLRVQDFSFKNSFFLKVSIFDQMFNFEIPVHKIMSPKTALSKSQYYAGILQVRNLNGVNVREVDKIVNQAVLKLDSFVTQRKNVKNGVDYYITSMKALRKASSVLKERFGAEVSFNEKLFTRDSLKSRDVYKVNALVRFYDFRVGDVVHSDDKLVLLKSNSGTGIDLVKNKRVRLNFSKEKFVKSKIYSAVVLSENPFKIMSPIDFQSVEVANRITLKREKQARGGKVRAVHFKGEWFVID